MRLDGAHRAFDSRGVREPDSALNPDARSVVAEEGLVIRHLDDLAPRLEGETAVTTGKERWRNERRSGAFW